MNGYNLKTRLLASSVFAGAALGLWSAAAVAQETDEVETVSTPVEEEDAVQETITVTGSRIAQSNFTSSTPVTVFDAQQIDLSGAVNTAEILRTLPAAGVSGFTSTNSNFFTNGSGLNTVELRNLTEDRTLVLVNGRRFVAGIPGTANVDLNSIPTEFIDRIDVVTGGASAIYGSDALAGVVNIILKDDFEGVVASTQYGISEYDDDETFQAAATFGSAFDNGRGHALASVSWSTEDGVYARDRGEQGRDTDGFSEVFFGDGDWQQSVVPFYSSFSERGRIIVPGAGNFVYHESKDQTRPFISAGADGGAIDGFNRQRYRAIAVPNERFLFSSVMNYEINPSANVFFEGTFATTDSSSNLEPFPLSSEDIFGDNLAQFVDTDGDGFSDSSTFGIPITNPFVPAGIATQARRAASALAKQEQLNAACIAAGLATSDDECNAENPALTIGAPVTFADEDLVVGFARRTTELINRGADNTRQTARFVLGMNGDLYNTDTWTYETSINFGRTTQAQRSSGQVNVLNFRNALDVAVDPETGEIVCADDIAVAQGCAPVNIFGLGSITDEAAEYLRAPSSRQAEVSQFVWQGFLSGELGVSSPMAANPFKMVVGSEYRSERSKSVPDALSQVGLNAGNISPVVEGDFQVVEAFTEFELPLIEGAQLAEELKLNLSARWSDYTTVGDTFAWAANLQYAPVDGFRLRAQYAEAVRAPNISELFQPLSETFEGGDDPCRGATLSGGQAALLSNPTDAGSGIDPASVGSNIATACLADPLVAARVARDGAFVPSQAEDQGIGGFNGGNPDLGEETAQTFTIGAIITPNTGNQWVDRLALSIDYYDIKVEDAIQGLARQTSLDQCYALSGGVYDPTTPFCSNVVRYASGPFTGAVDELNALQQNLATLETSGIDVQASYILPLNDVLPNVGVELGELTTTINYGYLEKYDEEAFPGADITEFAGGEGFFEHEYLLGFVYNRDRLTIAYDMNYLDETGLVGADDDLRVPAATFQDIQVRYQLFDYMELVGGVDNIDDEFIRYGGGISGDSGGESTGTFTNGAIYDAIGRRFYVGTRLTF